MYLRGRLVGRGLADACVTLEVRALPFRREALRRRDRSERRETTNAMRSNPSATPGPTTAGRHSAGNEGSDGPGGGGSEGAGGPGPKTGGHGAIGAAPPAPLSPLDSGTGAPCPASPLSPTVRAPQG